MTHLKPAAILALASLSANHSMGICYVQRALQPLGKTAPSARALVLDLAKYGLVTFQNTGNDRTSVVTITEAGRMALVLGTV